jgi:hypothetical protein
MFIQRSVEGERPAPLGSLLVVLALAALPLGADTIIATDFGPGNTYDSSTGHSWTTGATGDSGNAVGFVDPFALSYSLTQIQVADNFFESATDDGIDPTLDNLNVGLWASPTDLNDPGATELESWSVSTSDFATPEIFTLTPGSSTTPGFTPDINPGVNYFITETVPSDPGGPADNAVWGWQWNSLTPLQTGFYSEFSGGSWFPEIETVAEAALDGSQAAITPAFSVSGDPILASPVPEPRGYAALLAAGFLGILMALKRRRNVAV